MRAAVIHVVADAFVSVLVIIAIIVAGNVPNCGWMDPLVGIIGSFVILNWAYVLVVDTTANLLDLNPDPKLVEKLQARLEGDGSKVTDLHVWRLGPGHLGAIVSIDPPDNSRDIAYYMRRIKGFKALSHVTLEIEKAKMH
jgi:cation diffusion facilitator family transporter